MSGWWLGEEDGRLDQPYITPAQWAIELEAAGFQRPEAVMTDRSAPYQSSAGILASASPRQHLPQRITILCHTEKGLYVDAVSAHFKSLGAGVDLCRFGSALPHGQTVVSLLDLEAPTVHDLNEATFQQLVQHLRTLKSQMLWVTRSAQVGCQDPKSAMILGLARTARNEMSLKIFTLEVDDNCDMSFVTDAVARILARAGALDVHGAAIDLDWEYAVVDNEILVPRLHWQSMEDALVQAVPHVETDVKVLNVKTPGLLQTMHWVGGEEPTIGDDEVLIETRAVGLNFRVCRLHIYPWYGVKLTMLRMFSSPWAC